MSIFIKGCFCRFGCCRQAVGKGIARNGGEGVEFFAVKGLRGAAGFGDVGGMLQPCKNGGWFFRNGKCGAAMKGLDDRLRCY